MTYDALVIGAGHNGLVAACYLAGAGLQTHVIERREVVGGAAVTEEFYPGFRASTASYSLSLLRPDIHRDLRLAERGLSIRPKDPQLFVPLPEGDHFFVWRDEDRTVEELRKVSAADAGAYPRWNAFWEEAAALLRPLIEDPAPPGLEGVRRMLVSKGREDIWSLAVAGSAAETVSHFFASDEVRGAFASQGIIGTFASPREAGTAWVMTYHMLGGELCGATSTWGYVMGGMGALSEALASEAKARGVEIRTGAEVEEVLVEEGRASGVRLAGGEELESRAVLSGADPKRTFLRLLPAGALDKGFLEKVKGWRADACVVKASLALGELPEFRSAPGGLGPQHLGTISISPSIEYLDRAFETARSGYFSDAPFMEAFVQSAVDPDTAPAGRHVMSVFAQYAPETSSSREDLAAGAEDAILTTLAAHAPNIAGTLLAAQVLTPADLEARFGLTQGDIFHGAILPEQSFGERFDYRTPVSGLYLCGSGARPGGGVMGAAGRNAARALLYDWGKSV